MTSRTAICSGALGFRVLPSVGDVSLPLTRVGTLPLDRGGGRAVPAICPAADGIVIHWPGRLALWTPDLGRELWLTETAESSEFAVAGPHIIYPETYKSATPRIRVLDVASGREVRVLAGPARAGLTAHSPDSDVAIFRSVVEQSLLGWDLARGELQWHKPFYASAGVCVGPRLYVTSFDRRVLACLDCRSGEELWRFDVPQHGRYSVLLGNTDYATVLPDGDLIAITYDGQHFRLDAAPGSVRASMRTPQRTPVVVTEDEIVCLTEQEIVAYHHATMAEAWRVDWTETMAALPQEHRLLFQSGVHVGRDCVIWTARYGVVVGVTLDRGRGVRDPWTDVLPDAVVPIGSGPKVIGRYVYVAPGYQAHASKPDNVGLYCYRGTA